MYCTLDWPLWQLVIAPRQPSTRTTGRVNWAAARETLLLTASAPAGLWSCDRLLCHSRHLHPCILHHASRITSASAEAPPTHLPRRHPPRGHLITPRARVTTTNCIFLLLLLLLLFLPPRHRHPVVPPRLVPGCVSHDYKPGRLRRPSPTPPAQPPRRQCGGGLLCCIDHQFPYAGSLPLLDLDRLFPLRLCRRSPPRQQTPATPLSPR